ncbi:flavodoxin family protein [Peptoniphilus indolicus]|nr:flavodoxin family protein [Peptoniphilus indolicus]SUB74278.1 flavodoxin [Peptoniphilus indolicus]
MRGIIAYSSKTGNTKKMAEHIYLELKKICDVEIKDIKEIKKDPKLEEYDFALVGAWIDKGKPNKEAKNIIENTKQQNLGIFVTMGAMPDSPHGMDVSKNLEDLLKNRNSLGYYKCPGLVDKKLIEKMRGFTGAIVPKKIKEKMIQTSIESRHATEEELQEAADYFYEKLNKI